ncbi:MAG: hypothetical protein AVDCRST_MAG27-3878 [uncultured Craurococcus sp.]|uniref:Class I SAM-dependent methyltransferase n=1 Tax=uncultured Craurococcus sp. TaxID=1135998 RepID=A0A6J4JHC8_9PROT|nr:MAG: hypothetical protein AVDCRST_MAG27-3878 [uncultured Craurococcus sp.]
MPEQAVLDDDNTSAAIEHAIWSGGPLRRDELRPLPTLPHPYPEGWTSHIELVLLYNLARVTRGPILEIGPWLGRSTSAICAGIRDQEASTRPAFDTVDFGITSAEEWKTLLGIDFGPQLSHRVVVDAIYHPGGSMAVLIANLRRNNLLEFTTTITRGNILDMPFSRNYRMIFCDTTHDEREVRLYLPRIAQLARPGAHLVFDDVVTEDFADLICSYLPVAARRILHDEEQYSKQLLVKLC